MLEEFLPYRLSVLTNTVSASLARSYQKRFRLSIAQWRVLAVLGPEPGLSSNEVAERTAMDKVSVSRAVAGLVDEGRVLRREDPDDGRRLRLRLSAKGMSIYQRIVPIARELEHELLREMSSKERTELDRLLRRLRDAARRLSEADPERAVA